MLVLNACLAACLVPGCGGSSPKATSTFSSQVAPIRFQDMRPGSGLSFRLGRGPGDRVGIKETSGQPVALIDADGDGLLDVLLAGSDRVTLFRNLGRWRFQQVTRAGFRQRGYWQGVAVGDVNHDGRPDVFLSGFGCSALYLGKGDCRFRDVTASSGLGKTPPGRWQTSAAFADVDRDGRLDLYVTCYVSLGKKTGVCGYPGGVRTACSPLDFPPQRGTLYQNLGEGRFADVTARYGLQGAHGNGLGAAFGDPTDDGYPDLYLANDELPCDLYLNEGGRRFVNIGVSSGTAFQVGGSPQAGMGVDFGDYDNDGLEDLVVTNYLREPVSLYHNDGAGLFTNAAYSSHLGPATTAAVGWGVKWVDLDNDGLLDLAIANGHPLHRIRELDPTTDAAQHFQVFRNEGHGRFATLTSLGDGLPRALQGRALCAGDLDNDGRVDLVISDIEGEPLLLRNVTRSGNHWLTVRLVGKSAVEGARIVVRAGRNRWIRRSTTGGSYLSASDPRVHFGLGQSRRLDELEVRWPGGRTTVWKAPPIDQELILSASIHLK